VFFHGLYVVPTQYPIPPSTADGGPVGDSYSAFGSVMGASLVSNLAADGWVVLSVPAQEDTYPLIPSGGLYNDVANDSTYGARYLSSTLKTFDHIRLYIQQTYGSSWPILVGGFSIGGWRATKIASSRSSQVVGVFSHQPASIFETVSNNYTPGYNFGLLNWSGLDDVATLLNTCKVPVIIGYSSGDQAVYTGGNSTAATVNGGGVGVAAASVTALTVSGGSTSFSATSGSTIVVAGLTGGTSGGQAVYTYTGFTAGAFTGLSLVSGSGTVNVGCAVKQGMIDSFMTNARAAGVNALRNSGTEVHSLAVTDTGAYYAGTATTITAINTATTLQLTTTQAAASATADQYLTSGSCAIVDTTGTWHTFTFSGTTPPNLTGVSITGSGFIAAGAPIVNTGSAITGGFSRMSYPYWVSTVVDPSCPRVL
jgi:hypothetical protein